MRKIWYNIFEKSNFLCLNSFLKADIQCEGLDLVITCPIGTRINIISAFYGRQNTQTCLAGHEDQTGTTTCSSDQATTYVTNLCDDLSTCTVQFFIAAQVDDPCPGFSKYFSVTYSCI